MADAGRFEAFVRQHQNMVFGVAVRLLGSPEDAEDTAQTVFLKAYEHFDRIGESPTAAAWLRTVATNAALNQLTRYRHRRRLFSELGPAEDADSGAAFEDMLPGGESPLALLEDADRRANLERALHALPDHQRVPIVLFHFEDFSYQMIADRLGVSMAKVKSDIFRGRDTLRRVLNDDDDARS